MTSAWWKPREDGEATTDYLTRVLRAVRLHDIADRAACGLYDDYKCPTDCEWAGAEHIQLYGELKTIAARTHSHGRRHEILAIAEAVKTGEFDSTKAEADDWAKTPEAQAAMAEFSPELRSKLFGV